MTGTAERNFYLHFRRRFSSAARYFHCTCRQIVSRRASKLPNLYLYCISRSCTIVHCKVTTAGRPWLAWRTSPSQAFRNSRALCSLILPRGAAPLYVHKSHSSFPRLAPPYLSRASSGKCQGFRACGASCPGADGRPSPRRFRNDNATADVNGQKITAPIYNTRISVQIVAAVRCVSLAHCPGLALGALTRRVRRSSHSNVIDDYRESFGARP